MLGDIATLHSLSLSVNELFLFFLINSFSIPVSHVLLNITNTVFVHWGRNQDYNLWKQIPFLSVVRH